MLPAKDNGATTYVYVFDFEDRIKIGKSDDVNRRLRALEYQTGQRVLRQYSIPANPTLEKEIHKTLAEYRLIGEYFSYPFEEAVKLLDRMVPSPSPSKVEQSTHPLKTMFDAQLTNEGTTQKQKLDSSNPSPPTVFAFAIDTAQKIPISNMTLNDRIRILQIKRGNISGAELARRMGDTSQNLNNKMKRNNFHEKELLEIAEALNCTLSVTFRLNDTGEEV